MVNLKNDFFLLDIINQNSNRCLHTNAFELLTSVKFA